MIRSFLCSLRSAFKTRRELALENLALRQQLAAHQQSVKWPRLSEGAIESVATFLATTTPNGA